MQTSQKFNNYVKSGEPFIWLSAGALAFCLTLLLGLLSLITFNALTGFWPKSVYQFVLADKTILYGELHDSDEVAGKNKIKVKRANRDEYGLDFVWLFEHEILEKKLLPDIVVIERNEWGHYFGRFDQIISSNNEKITSEDTNFLEQLQTKLTQTKTIKKRILSIEKGEMEEIARQQETIRRQLLRHSQLQQNKDHENTILKQQQESLQKSFDALDQSRADLKAQMTDKLVMQSASGQIHNINLATIESFYLPNQLNIASKIKLYLSRLFLFLWENPREANTEGGVFPAIFGTVMLVLLMSVLVTPLGVLTAIYLHEYARPGAFVSIIRIAVNNLAGVPSIVFGVFGVGFFVYFVGGSIDRIFFADNLPAPTFGTGGILWAALTLALLTVPTVIVATEEGLSAIPRHMREAAYALGATKFETLCRVILPALLPAILTGLILAVARAAGEVAPLMITGVVKLAPDLPFDGNFPFFHIDRKFMHLGFHIFDLGFQSPNVDAARPTVYATTLLLLLLVIFLNATAIYVRNHLNKKLRTSSI